MAQLKATSVDGELKVITGGIQLDSGKWITLGSNEVKCGSFNNDLGMFNLSATKTHDNKCTGIGFFYPEIDQDSNGYIKGVFDKEDDNKKPKIDRFAFSHKIEVPAIELNGENSVGGYIDFHNPGEPDKDYSMRILSSTTNQLDILKLGDDTTINGSVKIIFKNTSSTIEANTFNALSDIRLKENFQPLSTEKSILDLPTYKFDFINGNKNQIGCKAQDLQEICPEIVDEGSDGYLSIQESKIVYLLLEEVKKLRKEIDELKGV